MGEPTPRAASSSSSASSTSASTRGPRSAACTPPPPAPPPVPPVDGKAHIAYPLGSSGDVWPPYSGGRRGFVSAVAGFSIPAVRPGFPAGVSAPSGLAFTGAVRGGVAAGDSGLEPFAELGGNLSGPSAMWLAAGLRWMLSPTIKRGADGVLAGVPFFIGPEILAGTFIQLPSPTETMTKTGDTYSSPAVARGLLGAALDLSFALAPRSRSRPSSATCDGPPAAAAPSCSPAPPWAPPCASDR